MVKFGVTENGFRRKKYNDILDNLQVNARSKFGENINLSDSSFLGMWLKNEAWEISELWELAEDVYYSAFVGTAEGRNLDGVGQYMTLNRKPAQKSVGEITIEATIGTKIPRNFKVSDEDGGKVFETTKQATVLENGNVVVPIVSVLPGVDMNVPPQTLVNVVNPMAGIERVYNTKATGGGAKVETDAEFRERYFRSPSGSGSTRAAVETALLGVESIVDAYVVENVTMEMVDGVPPKSIYCLVEGAADKEVANTILEYKAGGIRAYGDIEVEVEDSNGVEQLIGFSRPQKKGIHVKLNIERDDGYAGEGAVKRAIINYIGGLDEDGIFYKGLRLGQDVIVSRISSSVMCLGGIKDISVSVSLDGSSWQTTNIPNTVEEISETSEEKIVINYVE